MGFRNLENFGRPHLLEQLGADPAQVASLTVVSSPSGYGKSALLRQWMDAVGSSDAGQGRVYWVCARPESRPDGFWRDLAAGLGLPASRDPAGAVVRWARKLSEPNVLVLDSYETVTTPELDVALVDLLQEAPHLNVIVAASRLCSLLHPLQTSRVDFKVISEEGLRLSHDESVALAAEIDGLNEEDVTRIHKDFGGWALGVRAALLGYFHSDLEGTIWHFAEDLWTSLSSPEAQLAACAIGVCPGIDTIVVGEQLGLNPDQSVALGEELLRSGVVARSDRGPNRYECLPGVAPAFANWGHLVWDQAKLEKLRYQYALEMADADPIGSVRALIDLGEYGEADNVVARYQATALRAGASSLAALRKIPLKTLREYPQLLLTRLTFERPNPNFPIETVEELVRHAHVSALENLERAPEGELLPALVGAIATGRMSGSWEIALALSRDALGRVKGQPSTMRPAEIEIGAFPFASMANAALLAADFDLAREAAELALQRAIAQNKIGEERYARSLLANVALWQSDFAESREHLQRIDAIGAELRSEPDSDSPTKGPGFLWVEAEIIRVFLAVREGDFETAQRALDRLTPLMNRMEHWPLVALAESHFLAMLTGFHHAHTVLEERLAEKPELRSVAPYYWDAIHARRAALAMGRGRFDEAHRILGNLSPDFSYLCVPRARLALLENDLETARDASAQGLAAPVGPWQTFELSLVYAAAAHRLGEQTRAWQNLETAVAALRRGAGGLHTTMVPFEDLREVTEAWAEAYPDSPDPQLLKEALLKIPEPIRVVRHEPLTSAERQTLNAMLGAPTMAQVAEKLGVSANTVKFHQRAIYQKLGVNSGPAALAKASRIGLLD